MQGEGGGTGGRSVLRAYPDIMTANIVRVWCMVQLDVRHRMLAEAGEAEGEDTSLLDPPNNWCMFEPPQGSTDNDGGPGSAWAPRAPRLHPVPPYPYPFPFVPSTPLITATDVNFLHPSAGKEEILYHYAKLESPYKTDRRDWYRHDLFVKYSKWKTIIITRGEADVYISHVNNLDNF